MFSQVHKHYPKLNLRIACQRWLVSNPGKLKELAKELAVEPVSLGLWIRGSTKPFLIPAVSSDFIDQLVKADIERQATFAWNTARKGKTKEVRYSLVQEIRAEAAHRRTQRLIDEYRYALAPLLTDEVVAHEYTVFQEELEKARKAWGLIR